MPQPVVFLLHGMGNQQENWSKPAQDILKERAATLNSSWKLRLFELEYDSIFRNLLAAWATKSKEIVNAAQEHNKPRLKDMVGWLNGVDDKEDFGWSAAADVFLWRTADTIRKVIVNHLANQVAEVLSRQNVSMRNVHFVAHSLGTAVLHELLTHMAKGDWTPDGSGDVDGLKATRWRPQGIHTVANVSKLLELKRNPAYSSPVRPGFANDPDSYCFIFRNYAHQLDPFTIPKPFSPAWVDNDYYSGYRPILIRNPEEVHSFEHYMSLPVVHAPILESMFAFLPNDSDAFDYIPDGFSHPTAAVKRRLEEQIEKFGVDPGFFDTLRSVHRYFKGAT